jgi:hypothetical protein
MKTLLTRGLACATLVLAITIVQMPVTRAQTAPVVPKSRNDRWMADMAAAYPRYGELPLAQALFPGSHDSGSYALGAVFSPDIPALEGLQFALPLQVLIPSIKGWAETQHDDLAAQLNAGVRYLDLRLCAPILAADPVRFCHGLYGPTLEDGLNQIAAFAAQPEHRKEIILVHVALWHGFSDALVTSTRELIRTKLGTRMFPPPAGNLGASVTLEDVWDSGKSVIVVFNADGDGFWSSDLINSPWPGELDLAATNRHDLGWWRDTVVANLACRCNSPKTSTPSLDNVFFGLQVQATTNVLSDIVDPAYMTAYPFGNLEGVTDVTNQLIMPLVLDQADLNLNVVVTDFASEYGFVEAIKNLTVAKLDLLHHKVPGRAYLSRTESPINGPAVLTTSSNGTYFGYAQAIGHGNDFIAPGYPTLAHFGSSLFAGDLRVTSIADDFLKTPRPWTNGAGGFVTDLNPPGLPPGISLPASYGEAYGRFFVAWTEAPGTLHVRSSPDGRSFAPGDSHALPASSASVPVLATRRGELYIAWMTPGASLAYGRIRSSGAFEDLGTLASNLQARPAMTGYGDRLVFAWSDAGDRKIRVLGVDPATGVTTGITTLLQETTDAPPSLAVFKGSVVLAYTGQNKLRYTIVSADGATFSPDERSWQVPALSSNLTPPTLHAWGDRTVVTVSSMNADGTTYAPGTWTRQNVIVTFTCDAPVAGVHGFLADTGAEPAFVAGNAIAITLTGAGTQTASVRCVDLAGQVVAASAAAKIDRTPPTVTFVGSTPAAPASGWFTSDVVATFACSDAGSGVVNAQVTTTLSKDGQSQLAQGTCVDLAGNIGTGISDRSYDIDKTPPAVVVSTRTPAPNENGWNRSPVSLKYFVVDTLSGVSGPTISGVTFTADGKDLYRRVTVTDVAGNAADVDVRDPGAAINIDTVAPTLTVPESFSVRKAGQGPFAVTYSKVTFGDALSGLVAPGCDHPSGGQFDAGVTTVTCRASDLAYNVTIKTFDVTVVVNTAPVIAGVAGGPIDEGAPAIITVTASDPDGDDSITYEFDCDGDGTFEVAPQAGNTTSCSFGDNGARTVPVRATDALGAAVTSSAVVTVNNVAPSAAFSNNGPVDEGAGFTLTLADAADPSAADTSAGFQYAFDCGTGYGPFSSAPTQTCTAGGSGSLPIRATVRDKDGGEREYAATMAVNGVPPVVNAPASETAPASGPDGAIVFFDVSATDALDGPVGATCSPASGSTFAIGTTEVRCSATDHHGNTAGPVTFDVTVVDRTPPGLRLPADLTVDATRLNGAAVTFTATALDLVDGSVAVTCTPASGSTFPVGATTVHCAAADRANNQASDTFLVTVLDVVTPGEMHGDGFVRDGDTKYDFGFTVRERASGADKGRFTLRVTSQGRGHGRNRTEGRDDRFVARGVDAAFFSDDPTIRPRRPRRLQIDTVIFVGTGEWNGRAGYRYEVVAQDGGEPGRHRESVRITVVDPTGQVVAAIEGDLDGGNVQSRRLHR